MVGPPTRKHHANAKVGQNRDPFLIDDPRCDSCGCDSCGSDDCGSDGRGGDGQGVEDWCDGAVENFK